MEAFIALASRRSLNLATISRYWDEDEREDIANLYGIMYHGKLIILQSKEKQLKNIDGIPIVYWDQPGLSVFNDMLNVIRTPECFWTKDLETLRPYHHEPLSHIYYYHNALIGRPEGSDEYLVSYDGLTWCCVDTFREISSYLGISTIVDCPDDFRCRFVFRDFFFLAQTRYPQQLIYWRNLRTREQGCHRGSMVKRFFVHHGRLLACSVHGIIRWNNETWEPYPVPPSFSPSAYWEAFSTEHGLVVRTEMLHQVYLLNDTVTPCKATFHLDQAENGDMYTKAKGEYVVFLRHKKWHPFNVPLHIYTWRRKARNTLMSCRRLSVCFALFQGVMECL